MALPKEEKIVEAMQSVFLLLPPFSLSIRYNLKAPHDYLLRFRCFSSPLSKYLDAGLQNERPAA